MCKSMAWIPQTAPDMVLNRSSSCCARGSSTLGRVHSIFRSLLLVRPAASTVFFGSPFPPALLAGHLPLTRSSTIVANAFESFAKMTGMHGECMHSSICNADKRPPSSWPFPPRCTIKTPPLGSFFRASMRTRVSCQLGSGQALLPLIACLADSPSQFEVPPPPSTFFRALAPVMADSSLLDTNTAPEPPGRMASTVRSVASRTMMPLPSSTTASPAPARTVTSWPPPGRFTSLSGSVEQPGSCSCRCCAAGCGLLSRPKCSKCSLLASARCLLASIRARCSSVSFALMAYPD